MKTLKMFNVRFRIYTSFVLNKGYSEKSKSVKTKLKKNNMKNLLVLAIMLLSFNFTNAQKIWNNAYKSGSAVGSFESGKIWNNAYKSGSAVGSYEGGKIWNNAYKSGSAVGSYEGGKIWNNAYKSGSPVGSYEGGEAGGAAAAFMIIL